ncbi:hypothetical protein ZEAMMB73_Zm00001d050656 [Zea mays]|uniref:Uncharacterized protein n=1 Tax=Zea mays TaxID=4577 RepID=A0A1D6Q2T8_MAIZE|nr:hypothetical protein ZEAMMB73_Zm00001d050656 [Zea mays]
MGNTLPVHDISESTGTSYWDWEEDEEMIWCYQGQAPSPRNGPSSFA